MPFDGLATPLGYLGKFDQLVDLIETPGLWLKYAYGNAHGQYCLKELLNVVGIAETFEPIILKTAERVTEKEFWCIESFNDHPETAHADVVAVLRRVRDDLAAGRIRLPAHAAARPGVARDNSPRLTAPAPLFWRKLFG